MESAPIRDTPLRRMLTLTAIRLLKRWCQRCGDVLFLTNKICVKYGPFQHLAEAATMQFVAEHTSIPVPKVYCAFKHKNWTYIVMERVGGQMVGYNWPSRPRESKKKILSQHKAMITELRTISPPSDVGVANVDGGSLYDFRIPGSSPRFGPFKTVADFHRHLRNGFEAHPDHFPEVSELISLHEQSFPIRFTHSDLSSMNILVQGDKVVAILDWETAGWYPCYWEYTTASNVNPQNTFWRDEIVKFVEPYPRELEMEQLRMKYFGDF